MFVSFILSLCLLHYILFYFYIIVFNINTHQHVSSTHVNVAQTDVHLAQKDMSCMEVVSTSNVSCVLC